MTRPAHGEREGRPFTPDTLAERWGCSANTVRSLIRRGELRAFRLGGKLLRIPADAVGEYEWHRSQNTASESTEGSSSSSGTKGADDNAARLARMIAMPPHKL